jgi:hypothetical protein
VTYTLSSTPIVNTTSKLSTGRKQDAMLTADSHIDEDLHLNHQKLSDRYFVFENRLCHDIPLASNNNNDEDYSGVHHQLATHPGSRHSDRNAIMHYSTKALIPGPTGYFQTDCYCSACRYKLEARRNSRRRP